MDPRLRFVAAADAACAAYRRDEQEARDANDGDRSSQHEYLGRVASLLTDLAARIRALEAPAPGAETLSAYLASIDELAGHVIALRDFLDRNDPRYGEAAERVAEVSAAARRRARDYGFRICGSE